MSFHSGWSIKSVDLRHSFSGDGNKWKPRCAPTFCHSIFNRQESWFELAAILLFRDCFRGFGSAHNSFRRLLYDDLREIFSTFRKLPSLSAVLRDNVISVAIELSTSPMPWMETAEAILHTCPLQWRLVMVVDRIPVVEVTSCLLQSLWWGDVLPLAWHTQINRQKKEAMAELNEDS